MVVAGAAHRAECVFHVSEDRTIEQFVPRQSTRVAGSFVWAIDRHRLRNYLLPRDCPRVTCYAGTDSSDADIGRLLGTSPTVVAIEREWLDRVRRCRLYCYHLPTGTFDCQDDGAGYYVSRETVLPLFVEIIDDVWSELTRMGVELRLVDDLWPLHDAVAASTLCFSMIRMRNARVRRSVEA